MTTKKVRKPRRTQKELKATLFDTLALMMNEQKFRPVGINDLCESAGIEKNFIYTHFGDMDGLFKEYITLHEFWDKDLLTLSNYEGKSLKEMYIILLTQLYKCVNENIHFLNLIRWEVSSTNPDIISNASKRQEKAMPIINKFKEYQMLHPEIDLLCITALLINGIYYLALRKYVSPSLGIDFSKNEESERILTSIHQVADYLFDRVDNEKRIVAKLRSKNLSDDEIMDVLSISKETLASY